jgi:cysteine desulfurase family protein (TIGR01976 family)
MNRERFPGLDGTVRFDAPAGSQLVVSAADAIATYIRSPVANAHGGFPPSDRTDAAVAGARAAVANLFGTDPANVVFGPSMTALTYLLASTVADSVGAGDEIVCTRLDHEANVSPWRQLAESRSAHVRIAEPDPVTLELSVESVERVLSERTRWVAVTAASNASGSVPDVSAIVERVHARGARVVVDAVHAAPHLPLDFDTWGADAMFASAYKWFGPHGSMMLLAPELMQELRPRHLRGGPGPGVEQWERGALSFEQFPGIEAAATYLSETGLDRIGAVESELLDRLLAGLDEIPGVTVYGKPPRRTSTVLFNVEGHAPAEVAAALREREIYVWHGHFYAIELMDFLGIDGAVRAGLLHYNTADEVDRLLEALTALTRPGSLSAAGQPGGGS